MKKNPLLTTLVAAIAAGLIGLGIGFYAGKAGIGATMMANNAGSPSQGNQAGGNRFQGGARGQNGTGFANRNGVAGQIIASDDKSLTVKMPDGSSKIVLISSSTIYENTTKATQSDAKTGTQVRVIGTTNSDGSVTANTVMLNPVMFGQMPGQSPTSSSAAHPNQ